jgi:hypothetical protein
MATAGRALMLQRPNPQVRRRDRQRAYRKRQAAGSLMVTLELTPEDIARLYRLGYLRDCDLEDRRSIAAAIRALLANIVLDP